MKQEDKLNALDCISSVYQKSKHSELSTSLFKEMENELIHLSKILEITPKQSFFVALVFTLNYQDDYVDLNDLIKLLDCNPISLLKYQNDFKELVNKRILLVRRSRHRMRIAEANNQYVVNESVTAALINNEKIPSLHEEIVIDAYRILEDCYKWSEEIRTEEMSRHEVLKHLNELFESNQDIELVKRLEALGLNETDLFVLLLAIRRSVHGSDGHSTENLLYGVFDNDLDKVRYLQTLVNKENVLVEDEWLEIEKRHFFNDTKVVLTDKTKTLLTESDITLFSIDEKEDYVLGADKINKKELFFDENQLDSVNGLHKLLEEETLKETQERLAKKNLPIGFSILLHGAPGTGKTELVKQLARESGRGLVSVDISSLKSKWFGESQQLVKKVFTDYKKHSEKTGEFPILLLNEADAIISKRQDVDSSSVAQVENAIQNILLEEIENFEGVLVATTNLANNFDSAFERRFLYKLELSKPSHQTRAKIWHSKLKNLSIEECEQLSSMFEFSGGQIDNIVRKSEIEFVINGEDPDFLTLKKWCQEETLESMSTKIGFGTNIIS